jgi:hypothetical protein
VIGFAQFAVFQVLLLVVLVMSGFALIDAALRPASAFKAAEKQTKVFWVSVLAAATAVAFVSLGFLVGGVLLPLLAAVGSGIYLADVRPKVAGYSGRGGGRGRRRPPRGGW